MPSSRAKALLNKRNETEFESHRYGLFRIATLLSSVGQEQKLYHSKTFSQCGMQYLMRIMRYPSLTQAILSQKH